jgi:3',5'-cyclic AMP phosphodiesterase CpdA
MHPEPLRIVHITDTHIIVEPGAEVYGINSFAALESLLTVMQRDAWIPHLLIATGDLSEDRSAVSYQRLRNLLTSVGLPVYCIPSNHDVLSEMHAHLRGELIHLECCVVWEPWQIVLLDSQVPGQGHGSPSSWLRGRQLFPFTHHAPRCLGSDRESGGVIFLLEPGRRVARACLREGAGWSEGMQVLADAPGWRVAVCEGMTVHFVWRAEYAL